MIQTHKNHLDANADGVYDIHDVLVYIQWIMIILGTIFNFVTILLYGPICKLVHEELKENIFLHLEGNAFVYENFFQVCHTRGVLKLDFVANLLFFTSTVFILIFNQVEEEQFVWIFVGSLFGVLVISELFGGYTTILSARKRMYIAFIVLRSIVEIAKIIILVFIWAYDLFLW